MRRALHEDAGVFAVLYALIVVVIVMTAAIVVDLSSLREDRRAERLATDAAATAGALQLNALTGVANAQEGCREAWRFLAVNLPGASGATAVCPIGTFPTSFSSSSCPTTAGTATGPAGPWQVTITWPVPDNDSLMTTPNVTGVGTYQQPVDAEIDGADRCSRLGVTVSRNRQFMFAGVGGFVSGATSNSSVARADLNGNEDLEFPLVVLDQNGCQSLAATGSSPSGAGIIVQNNGITPGRIAIDSAGDASGNPLPGCGNPNSYTAEASGGSRIVAWNGSTGAAGQILSFGPVAKAASSAQLCTAGTDPATVTDRICPAPTAFTRITRKHWDWRYHCTSTTSEPLSAPCPYTSTTPDYISRHRSNYGPATLNATTASGLGFTVLSGADCDSGTPYRYFPPGNYYVDCTTFTQSKTTVFGGGVVVFRGDVDLKGAGGGPYCTVFNQELGDAPGKDSNGFYPTCNQGSVINLPDTDTDSMYVYLQNGSLSRQNSDLIAPQTFFYQETSPTFGGSPDHRIEIGAGTSGGSGVSGTLVLTAPVEGDFENLAVWSENTAPSNDPNGLGAQTRIALEGIFFLPNGQVEFTGNGTYLGPPRAQFVAWRLRTAGGAQLVMVPDAERTLTIPVGGVRLIR